MFSTNYFISQVIIFGDNRPFLIALIFVNNEFIKKKEINNEIDIYVKKNK